MNRNTYANILSRERVISTLESKLPKKRIFFSSGGVAGLSIRFDQYHCVVGGIQFFSDGVKVSFVSNETFEVFDAVTVVTA